MAAELKHLFEQHGFSPVKAELWSEFVHHVLSVFNLAADDLRKSENWEHFKQKRGALGRPRSRRRQGIAGLVPNEDAITSELAPFIRHIRRTLPKNHFLRLNEVEFHAEELVESDTRAGRHSRKTDFSVYAVSGEEGPEMAIEAKPLLKEADINGRYLSQDGIGCFFDVDSPYTRGPLGGMLAYTMNGNGRSWRAEIRSAMSKYKPPVLYLDDAIVKGESEPLPFSRHRRSALNLDPIAIIHLELIFSTNIQERS